MIFSTYLHHRQGYWSFLRKYSDKFIHSNAGKPVLYYSASHKYSASNSTQTSISSRLNNKHITTNKKNNNILNKDDIQSCVTARKQIYSVQATYTTTRLAPLNASLPIAYVKLHTRTELPHAGKE